MPVKRYELKQYANGTVHKNGHIYLSKDKHYYSVPYKYLGKKIRIIYSEDLVEVHYKYHQIAVHTKNKKKYTKSTCHHIIGLLVTGILKNLLIGQLI